MALFVINIQMDTYICLCVHRVLYAADWKVLIKPPAPIKCQCRDNTPHWALHMESQNKCMFPMNMTFHGLEFGYNKLSSSHDDALFYCDPSLFTLSITDYILFPYIQINCNPADRDTDQTKQVTYLM